MKTLIAVLKCFSVVALMSGLFFEVSALAKPNVPVEVKLALAAPALQGAPNTAEITHNARVLLTGSSSIVFSHSTVASYRPGTTITVTNSIQYSDAILSLICRPLLPAGWTVASVTGDGSPILLGGEVAWTGFILPPSPIQLTYVVNIPSNQQGNQQLSSEIEYQTVSMINPATLRATPDPLALPIASTLIYSAGSFTNVAGISLQTIHSILLPSPVNEGITVVQIFKFVLYCT